MMFSGGIREEIPRGEITLEKLYRAVPFNNTLKRFKIPYKVIVELIERGLRDRKPDPHQSSSFLQLAGLRVHWRERDGEPEVTRVTLVEDDKEKPLREGDIVEVLVPDVVSDILVKEYALEPEGEERQGLTDMVADVLKRDKSIIREAAERYIEVYRKDSPPLRTA